VACSCQKKRLECREKEKWIRINTRKRRDGVKGGEDSKVLVQSKDEKSTKCGRAQGEKGGGEIEEGGGKPS